MFHVKQLCNPMLFHVKQSGHNNLPSFAAFIFFPAQIGQNAAVEFINKDVEAAFRAVIGCADEPEAVFQVFRSGQPFQEVVGRGFKELGIKCVAIQIDRQRVDLTFQQVLKEVGAQGGFVGILTSLPVSSTIALALKMSA